MRRGRVETAMRLGLAGMAASLGGCAARPPVAILVPPAPPPVVRVEPQPPAGASANLVIPPVGPDGAYLTINHGLSPAGTMWHVRSALNVAALGCRGVQEARLTADYNALLASKKALLAQAFAATEAEARQRFGKDWRDEHDRQMTRVYNFFAQPPAKTEFCTAAATIATQAAVVPATGYEAFAATALPQLEAPFLAFYRVYDRYRRDLAAWQASGTRPAGATVASPYPPVAPAASPSGDRRIAATGAPPAP